jgi:hypothetical protein
MLKMIKAIIIKAMSLFNQNRRPTKRAPDAGDSGAIPSLFLRLAFFQSDGFAVPAPARVTQTVSPQIRQQGYL